MSPQHDYVIDNSTGANVRADINNALLAISSNNSGSSAPSTTYALQSFANTTDTMLQLRNAANSAFVNLRKFDGSCPLPDGTNSAPSLFFDDDTNTGLYSSASDTLNFATGGTERLELGSTTVFNEDGADVDFRIEGDSEVNLFYVDAGNNRIGIGTNAPSVTLDIESTAPTIRFTDSDASGTPECEIRGGGGDLVLSADRDDEKASTLMLFQTDGSTAMTVDSGQRVLIGSSTALSVASGTTGLLQLTRTVGAVHQSINLFTNDSSGGILAFGKSRGTSVGSYTVVQQNDELGVIRFAGADGTDLVPIGASISAFVDGTAGSNDMPARLIFSTTGDGAQEPTERLRIGNNGYMSLGTGTSGVDSAYRFHIKNSTFGLLKLETTLTGADGAYLELKHTSTSPADNDQLGIIQFKGKNDADEDNTYGYLMFRSIDVSNGSEDGELQVVTQVDGTAAARLTVGQDGAITAGTGNFVIGTSGRGLQFNAADSGSSEILDDYEEGTYTPSFGYNSDDGNKAYSTQSGSYTKIGRIVIVNICVILTNRGTGSGQVTVSLPFAVADVLAGTSIEASGMCGFFSGLSSSVSTINLLASHSTTNASLHGLLGTSAGGTSSFTYAFLGNASSFRFSLVYPAS